MMTRKLAGLTFFMLAALAFSTWLMAHIYDAHARNTVQGQGQIAVINTSSMAAMQVYTAPINAVGIIGENGNISFGTHNMPAVPVSLLYNNGLTHSASVTRATLPLPNDPYFVQQWALSKLGIPSFWAVAQGSPEITVAVLDTGIDESHEDLEGKVVATANFTDSPTTDDVLGHGTHVAGIIAAQVDNSIGIAGVAPECHLLNVKVAEDDGMVQMSNVVKGIIWATDHGANVVNMSLCSTEPCPPLEKAINYAWSRGVVLVAAAGNFTGDKLTYPASYEKCIAVAATDSDDSLALGSGHRDWVDVAAPGTNIYSTLCNNNYGYKTGTSFAAAHVSGLATLLFSLVTDTNGDCRLNDEIRVAIEAGSQQIGINEIKYGRIDAVGSLFYNQNIQQSHFCWLNKSHPDIEKVN
jgi:thermitase